MLTWREFWNTSAEIKCIFVEVLITKWKIYLFLSILFYYILSHILKRAFDHHRWFRKNVFAPCPVFSCCPSWAGKVHLFSFFNIVSFLSLLLLTSALFFLWLYPVESSLLNQQTLVSLVSVSWPVYFILQWLLRCSCKPPHWLNGLSTKCSITLSSILFKRFARAFTSTSAVTINDSQAYRNTEMTRECPSFTFDPRDIYYPSKSAPRNLKVATVPDFCHLTLVSFWITLALFVSLVL